MHLQSIDLLPDGVQAATLAGERLLVAQGNGADDVGLAHVHFFVTYFWNGDLEALLEQQPKTDPCHVLDAKSTFWRFSGCHMQRNLC